jgi:hypothetical protein
MLLMLLMLLLRLLLLLLLYHAVALPRLLRDYGCCLPLQSLAAEQRSHGRPRICGSRPWVRTIGDESGLHLLPRAWRLLMLRREGLPWLLLLRLLLLVLVLLLLPRLLMLLRPWHRVLRGLLLGVFETRSRIAVCAHAFKLRGWISLIAIVRKFWPPPGQGLYWWGAITAQQIMQSTSLSASLC